jgi:hypothetical protein
MKSKEEAAYELIEAIDRQATRKNRATKLKHYLLMDLEIIEERIAEFNKKFIRGGATPCQLNTPQLKRSKRCGD